MNSVKFDFTGANVLVTGGTSGIGNAIATAFSASGASVTVTGTRKSPNDYGNDLTPFTYRQCQLSDQGSIDSLVSGLGALDILINNAGHTRPGGVDEWDPDGYADSVAVNLTGPMRLTMACHDRLTSSLLAGGACVVSIISMSAYVAAPSVPAYGSSKAGMVALTRNLCRRWHADGIRVNAVAPGVIDTPMTHPIVDMPQVLESELRHIPMARLGTAEETAPTVLFLCSDAARYITGTTFVVDGGYLTV